ncbi:MAG: hypothetical protein IK073_01490 [Paludibacteraceae bacterium]|nr:hypothetical protein [Paludibacteraceae bacterium]
MRRYLLAILVALTAGLAVQAQSVEQQRAEPIVLYGYLKVFPNDLGTFDAEPRTVIARLNEQQQYGYGTWRLPTNEELSLMRGSNVIGSGEYMTKENKRGIVRLVTDKEKGDTLYAIAAGYVDLGLPSGTLWKEQNEIDGFCTYEQAIALYGNGLPTKEQLEELKLICKWTWTGSGYEVEGPSGATITLPAAGYRDCYGSVKNVGSDGYFWSSTPYNGSELALELYFNSGQVDIDLNYRCAGRSVRLVR